MADQVPQPPSAPARGDTAAKTNSTDEVDAARKEAAKKQAAANAAFEKAQDAAAATVDAEVKVTEAEAAATPSNIPDNEYVKAGAYSGNLHTAVDPYADPSVAPWNSDDGVKGFVGTDPIYQNDAGGEKAFKPLGKVELESNK